MRDIADGLRELLSRDQPFAVAFDKRGAMYITERANELPSAAGSGRVLRLAPAAYGR